MIKKTIRKLLQVYVLSPNSIPLASDRQCCLGVSLGYETNCKEPKCMQDIRVEDVMRAIYTLLKY